MGGNQEGLKFISLWLQCSESEWNFHKQEGGIAPFFKGKLSSVELFECRLEKAVTEVQPGKYLRGSSCLPTAWSSLSAKLWRKQNGRTIPKNAEKTSEDFNLQSHCQLLLRKGTHPSRNIGWDWFFSVFSHPAVLMFPASSVILFNCIYFHANKLQIAQGFGVFHTFHKTKCERKITGWFCLRFFQIQCVDNKET